MSNQLQQEACTNIPIVDSAISFTFLTWKLLLARGHTPGPSPTCPTRHKNPPRQPNSCQNIINGDVGAWPSCTPPSSTQSPSPKLPYPSRNTAAFFDKKTQPRPLKTLAAALPLPGQRQRRTSCTHPKTPHNLLQRTRPLAAPTPHIQKLWCSRTRAPPPPPPPPPHTHTSPPHPQFPPAAPAPPRKATEMRATALYTPQPASSTWKKTRPITISIFGLRAYLLHYLYQHLATIVLG